MEPIAIVTVLILIQYFIFAGLVGKVRVQTKIDAPAVTGDPIFERYFRVHQNTLEQLIVVLPALWLFGWFIDPLVGGALGLVFILGRWIYCRDYVVRPPSRSRGFVVGWLAQIILILGALIGAILSWLE
ncbi:MAG: hypothetical protein CL799_03195 [Chromatiales bacterium]|nr:hypothetical protein [Chromatiales bacterium]